MKNFIQLDELTSALANLPRRYHLPLTTDNFHEFLGADHQVPAAVIIPIINHASGLTLLFTQRTSTLLHHPGQISFPGGRVEPQDKNLEMTALRETFEEIGLSAQQIQLIGELPPYHTVATGYTIAPLIGLITPPYELTLDPVEVETTFEAPLDFVLDPKNNKRETHIIQGQQREYDVIQYQRWRIWGVTARILVSLSQILSPSNS